MLFTMKKGIKIFLGIICVLMLAFVGFTRVLPPGQTTPRIHGSWCLKNKMLRALSEQRSYRADDMEHRLWGLEPGHGFFFMMADDRWDLPDKSWKKNIAAIEKFLVRQNDIDFFFIAGSGSRRQAKLLHWYGFTTINGVPTNSIQVSGKIMMCFFVPIPVFDPLGHVSGRVTDIVPVWTHVSCPAVFSREPMHGPGECFCWTGVFLVSRYRLEKGKKSSGD